MNLHLRFGLSIIIIQLIVLQFYQQALCEVDKISNQNT